ncbi:MAG: sulfatase-like hydrolase/transferase [Bdellovibrionales bacterium]|nr:sulfatase-like hydrolase/transferase [Bdellovibrionales bacterium]
MITLLFNSPALLLLIHHAPPTANINKLFFISSFFVLYSLVLLSLLPFYIFNFLRTGSFFVLCISAATTYFTYKFGIIFDETTSRSIFETTYGEASQYMNWRLVAWQFVFIFAAGSYISLFRWEKENLLTRLSLSLKITALATIVFTCVGLTFYKDYATFLRNNQQFRHLLQPIGPVYQIAKFLKLKYFPKTITYTPIGLDAHRKTGTNQRERLVVFVLGETARSDHFSINGYIENLTTPELQQWPIVSLPRVQACGTATSISVPCLFSNLGRSRFESSLAASRGNLLDVALQAHYKVSWLDNNTGCQGVCNRVGESSLDKYRSAKICKSGTCYDEILIKALKEIGQDHEDHFVVLHMLGSHGPSYHLRYPEEFKKFKPSCDTNELGQCTREQVKNTYDNTIAYTDHILSEIIRYLDSLSDLKDTALIYVSDHGESLGENGLYLHSLPYFMAPKEQKSVPMIFWFSPNLRKSKQTGALALKSPGLCQYTHDNIFSTTLDILDIQTDIYQPDLDLLKIDPQFCSSQN